MSSSSSNHYEYQKARKEFIDCVLRYSKCIHDGGEFQDCIKSNVPFPQECDDKRKRLAYEKYKQYDRRIGIRNDDN